MLNQIKRFFGAQDLTVGSPTVNLLKFSVPLLIGNVAQQLYSTVDSIIVGRYVGDTALASIGATMPVINLLLVLFMAVATGAGILVSQYFGARSWKNLDKAVGNALSLIFLSSVIMMAIAIPLAEPILSLLGTPDEIIGMSSSYMRIIFIGILGFGFFNITSGILRGLGDSITPLLFLLLTAAMNTVLDIWFVAYLDLGVSGAAVATVLSQVTSAILCLIRLTRMRDVVSINRSSLKISRQMAGQLLKIGMPAGLTQAVFSLAMVVVQALTNSMGYQVITTTTAVMRIDGFAMMPNFTFGIAVTTFVGQNMGAGKIERVDRGSRSAALMAVGVSAFLTLTLLLFSGVMIRLFTDTQAIVDLGIRQIRILAAGYIAMSMTQVFGGIMRGAGDTMPSMWIAIFTTVGIRVPVAYTIAWFTRSPEWPNGSPDALFISLLSSWVLGAVLTYSWYRRGHWRKKQLVKASEKNQGYRHDVMSSESVPESLTERSDSV